MRTLEPPVWAYVRSDGILEENPGDPRPPEGRAATGLALWRPS